MKFQYLLIPGKPYVSSPVLKSFGEDGWELVSVTGPSEDGTVYAYFKRPISKE